MSNKGATTQLDLRLGLSEQRRQLSLINRPNRTDESINNYAIISSSGHNNSVLFSMNEPQYEAMILEDMELVSIVITPSITMINDPVETTAATESFSSSPISYKQYINRLSQRLREEGHRYVNDQSGSQTGGRRASS